MKSKPIISYILFVIILFSCREVPPDNPSIVLDADGNEYAVLFLGEQQWMASNLKTTRFANGEPIPHVISNGDWINLDTPGWAKFDDSDSLVRIYGLLYNYLCTSDPRNVCPEGWHVPSHTDWQDLIDYLGGDSIAGGKLKETGVTHWEANVAATDESGMCMLPGGYRSHANGWSNSLGIIGFWWTSTETDSIKAYSLALRYYDSYTYRRVVDKGAGQSIRCVKD